MSLKSCGSCSRKAEHPLQLGAGHVLAAFVGATFAGLAASFAIGLHPFAEAGTSLLLPLAACGELLGGPAGRAIAATSVAAVLSVAHLVAGVVAWRRARRGLADLVAAMDHLPTSDPDRRLMSLAEDLGMRDSLIVVNTDDQFALTAGSDRIYISSGAAAVLTDQELTAVLMHEKHHLENRDASKAELIAILRRTFGYLPGIRRLTDRFIRSREFAADDAALGQAGNPRALLAAFVKLHPAQPSAPATAGYTDFATLRARRLLGKAHEDDLSRGDIASAVATFAVPALPPALAFILTEPHIASLILGH